MWSFEGFGLHKLIKKRPFAGVGRDLCHDSHGSFGNCSALLISFTSGVARGFDPSTRVWLKNVRKMNRIGGP